MQTISGQDQFPTHNKNTKTQQPNQQVLLNTLMFQTLKTKHMQGTLKHRLKLQQRKHCKKGTNIKFKRRFSQNSTKPASAAKHFDVPNTQNQTHARNIEAQIETTTTKTLQEGDKHKIQTPVFTKLNQDHVHDTTLPYEIRFLICDINVSVYEINIYHHDRGGVHFDMLRQHLSALRQALFDMKHKDNNRSWDEIIHEFQDQIGGNEVMQKTISMLQIAFRNKFKQFVYVTNEKYTVKHTYMMFLTPNNSSLDTTTTVGQTYDQTLHPGFVYASDTYVTLSPPTLGQWDSMKNIQPVNNLEYMRLSSAINSPFLISKTFSFENKDLQSRIKWRHEFPELPIGEKHYFWWYFMMRNYSNKWKVLNVSAQSFFKTYIPHGNATNLLEELDKTLQPYEGMNITFFIGMPGQQMDKKYFQTQDRISTSKVIVGTKKPGILFRERVIERAKVTLGTLEQCRQLYADFCFPEIPSKVHSGV